MAASRSSVSVMELALLQCLAMAAISSPYFGASMPVEATHYHRHLSFELAHVPQASARAEGRVACLHCDPKGQSIRSKTAPFLPDHYSLQLECEKSNNDGESFVTQALSYRDGRFVFNIPSSLSLRKCRVHVLSLALPTKAATAESMPKLWNILNMAGGSLYQSEADLISFVQASSISDTVKPPATLNNQVEVKLERKLPRKLIRKPHSEGHKPMDEGHKLLRTQTGRRSLLTINKHGKPATYHLEPPDPPQPLYPASKDAKAIAPAHYLAPPIL